MAKETGLQPTLVARVWRAHGIRPHRVRYFKLSTDPHFVEKLRDVVGLYVSPPERAIVLSFDEKSQIQALDRTQPGLQPRAAACESAPGGSGECPGGGHATRATRWRGRSCCPTRLWACRTSRWAG